MELNPRTPGKGDWRSEAKCAGAEPTLFEARTAGQLKTNFKTPERDPVVRQALEYCNECPVRAECYDEAVNEVLFPVDGVWGGVHISWSRANKNLEEARKAKGITAKRANQWTEKNQ